MQTLTNLRFRFNDGEFIKHMAYPEVKITFGTEEATLFNVNFHNQDKFNKAFKSIIWVSYRKGFNPLVRGGITEQIPGINEKLSALDQKDAKLITSDCGWGCMIRCS